MRGLLTVAFLLSALSAANAANSADDLKTCRMSSATDDVILAACQRVASDPYVMNGDRAQALFIRVAIHSKVGKLDLALTDINEAIRLGSAEHQFLRARANTLHLLKDYPAAIRDATEALKEQSNDTQTLIIRAVSYAASDQHPLAVADLSRAIEIEATSVAHRFRAMSFVAMGDASRARADLEQALRLPDSTTLLGPAHELARAELVKLAAPAAPIVPPVAPAPTPAKPKAKAPSVTGHPPRAGSTARKAGQPCRIVGRYSGWVAPPDGGCNTGALPKAFW